MFGLPSLGKLLALIGAVALIWYGFKLVRRLEQARRAEEQRRGKAALRYETIVCPRCGTYVPAGTRARCERDDCPLA